MRVTTDCGAPTFPDVLVALLDELVSECHGTGLVVNRLVVTYDLQTVTIGMFADSVQIAEVSM